MRKTRKAIEVTRTIRACDLVGVMNGSSLAIIRRNDGSKAASFGFALTVITLRLSAEGSDATNRTPPITPRR